MTFIEIILTNGWIIFLSIIIVLIILGLYNTSKELATTKNKVINQELEFKKKEAELKFSFQQWAIDEFEKFKANEINSIKREADQYALNAAQVVLQQWKIENEAKIRQDAINRSYSVNLGKITEHLVPFSSSFLSQFNPKDARFIGSPIDLIVFDGCSDKREDIVTYFVEIKTGNSRLTEIQKKIKASILRGDVRWAEINPDLQRPITIEYQDQKLKPITDPEQREKIHNFFQSLKVDENK
jgi:predicted Holliday junction resolvase-like endonuclease